MSCTYSLAYFANLDNDTKNFSSVSMASQMVAIQLNSLENRKQKILRLQVFAQDDNVQTLKVKRNQ